MKTITIQKSQSDVGWRTYREVWWLIQIHTELLPYFFIYGFLIAAKFPKTSSVFKQLSWQIQDSGFAFKSISVLQLHLFLSKSTSANTASTVSVSMIQIDY